MIIMLHSIQNQYHLNIYLNITRKYVHYVNYHVKEDLVDIHPVRGILDITNHQQKIFDDTSIDEILSVKPYLFNIPRHVLLYSQILQREF